MFASTAKGFHVHPPSVPEGSAATDWLHRLFVDEPENYSLRRYDDEQWDVMFFLQGRVEMILCDIRAGLPRRVMRFFVDGDNHRGNNNVGVVIPAGVAHAIRVEGGEDVIMVYGTSTVFHPEFEGRIASEIENAELPESWQKFLEQSGK
jgi:dTDP-4-dehydrorhamnose 3,5-epimerase-like enzyme